MLGGPLQSPPLVTFAAFSSRSWLSKYTVYFASECPHRCLWPSCVCLLILYINTIPSEDKPTVDTLYEASYNNKLSLTSLLSSLSPISLAYGAFIVWGLFCRSNIFPPTCALGVFNLWCFVSLVRSFLWPKMIWCFIGLDYFRIFYFFSMLWNLKNSFLWRPVTEISRRQVHECLLVVGRCVVFRCECVSLASAVGWWLPGGGGRARPIIFSGSGGHKVELVEFNFIISRRYYHTDSLAPRPHHKAVSYF